MEIILVEPSDPGNVGAVARAMDNMGVFQLKLINPCHHLDPKALQRATHAQNILLQAQIFPHLKAAINHCHLAIAFTARTRTRHATSSLWQLQEILAKTDLQENHIALIFGRERNGLTNEELDLCTHYIEIPTFGENSSLNLAQAVIVALYEITKVLYQATTITPQQPLSETASVAEIEGLKQHLFHILDLIRYIRNEQKRKTLLNTFSALIARTVLTAKDIRLLRGILNRIQVALNKKSKNTLL